MKTLRPKLTKRFFLIFSILFSVSFCNSLIANPQTNIQKWIAINMPKYKVVGASVAVINNYKVTWSEGFGYRNLAKKKPVTNNTLFNAASISKPVTSVAALITFYNKNLSLNKNINYFLSGWKVPNNQYTKQQPVTMRLLLSHSAGITDFRAKGYLRNAKIPTTNQVLMGQAPANTPAVTLKWKPGTHYAYSPGGYMIAQKALMDIYKQPFPKLLNDTLLKPMDMDHSTFKLKLSNKDLKQTALSYLPNDQLLPNGPLIFPMLAAGGLWTTPNDLAKFIIAIERANTGKPDSVITTKVATMLLKPSIDNNWGTGIEINLNDVGVPVKSGKYFGHTGWNSGYLGYIIGNSAGGNGVVVLLNTAPYMTSKGRVIQYDFMAKLIIEVAKEYKWKN